MVDAEGVGEGAQSTRVQWDGGWQGGAGGGSTTA